ncbi:MAG: InlB B-repeat-containing protein, partial [Kiritimatiellae bacterium]|nr:InlB B-repeat-containing protein [Kiritimatiellia bacterium]
MKMSKMLKAAFAVIGTACSLAMAHCAVAAPEAAMPLNDADGAPKGTYLTIDGSTTSWTWTLSSSGTSTDKFYVGCDDYWSVSTSASWIGASPRSGTGSATVYLAFTANPYSYSRSGTVTVTSGIRTRTISVTQPASTLYLTIDGKANNWTWTRASGSASSDSFSVGCNGYWTASTSASWITLGRTSGTGSYAVSISFAANPYSYSRTGTVTVRAGSLTRTITVTQPGGGPAPASYLTIDGEAYNWTWTRASYVSSTDSFAIGCDGAWTASSSVSWIRLGATSGSGNRTVSVSIDANPYTYSRTGVITVKAGSFTRTISVTQPGKPSTYTVYFDANGGTIPGYGSSRSVTVTYGTRNYYSVPGATRGGYTFTGWYTSGGTQVYDAKGQAVAGGTYWDYNQRWNYYGGVTLYARWAAPSTYTVYFNANGGTIPGYGSSRSVTVTYGTRNYYSVPGATRGGYRFLGWYTSTSGGTQVYDARGQAVAYSTYWDGNQRWRYYGSVTLYARWEQTASSYTVYFNA